MCIPAGRLGVGAPVPCGRFLTSSHCGPQPDQGIRVADARLYFVNRALQQVFAFTGQDAASAPREIIPQRGDTFTILEKWMDLDDQGNVVQTVRQEGSTLTFTDRMFAWEVLDAAAGQYVVGFIIEDLDGNSQVAFQPVTVR